MSVVPLFKETPFRNQVIPRSAMVGQYSFPLDNAENFSLRLAEKEDFLAMCESSLWGNESVQEFGLMLRGAVENFKPRNRWHLVLLANVCDAQWKLNRVRKLQQAIYSSQPLLPGKDGVPVRTEKAISYEPLLKSSLDALQTATNIYNKACK